MQPITSYLILPEQKLTIANLQGKIELDVLISLFKQIISDGNFKPSYHMLIDFSSSIAVAFAFDVLDFLQFFETNIQLVTRIRCGILLNTPNFKFLVSYAKLKSGHLNMDIEDFLKLEDCLTWIGFSTEEQIEINEKLISIKIKTRSLYFS